MQPIAVVALGVYRHVAASMDTTFIGIPYRMAAILDLISEPATFRHSSHNLGVVLHALQPRPQVFITGAAISEEMTKETIGIWEAYVKNTGIEDALVINLQGEPPADGDWRAEILRRLDARYQDSKQDCKKR